MAQEQLNDMSFFDHLDEMRNRVIWSLIGVVIGCILTGIFINEIMDYVLLIPAKDANMELQNLKPFGQAFLYFKVIFITGLILSFPWVLWNLWKFIAPGLYVNERGWARRITLFTSLCFIAGVLFAYFFMIPSMAKFSSSFGSASIKNNIDVNEYFGFITTTILAAGLIFELPMITYVLARFGIVTAAMLRKYRRHSIVVILIIAAVLTPSPDPVNQLMFAVPLWVLFEISIIIAALTSPKEGRNE